MVNKQVITASVITMVAFIMSVISMFIGFIFLPLLNGVDSNVTNSTGAVLGTTNSQPFMTDAARSLLTEVYPVLMILIPLFVLIGGLTFVFVATRKK